jgi:hypothetical protein
MIGFFALQFRTLPHMGKHRVTCRSVHCCAGRACALTNSSARLFCLDWTLH